MKKKLNKDNFDDRLTMMVNNIYRPMFNNKNRKLLESFTAYCKENPDQRFWQALRNWAGVAFILTTDKLEGGELHDTFYTE